MAFQTTEIGLGLCGWALLESVHNGSYKKEVSSWKEVFWKLPDGIIASSKGDQYAHCKLCKSDISVAHGGFNYITHHVRGPTHQQRCNSTKDIADVLGQPSELSHIRTITIGPFTYLRHQ